jgi:effector-binding domain-containing protein
VFIAIHPTTYRGGGFLAHGVLNQEVKAASCIIKSCYDQMGETYATVALWIKANGYKMNELMFNIYHVSPAQTQNPDEYVTEACFPIE